MGRSLLSATTTSTPAERRAPAWRTTFVSTTAGRTTSVAASGVERIPRPTYAMGAVPPHSLAPQHQLQPSQGGDGHYPGAPPGYLQYAATISNLHGEVSKKGQRMIDWLAKEMEVHTVEDTVFKELGTPGSAAKLATANDRFLS